MKPLSYKWNKTKNIYLDWLLKNDLKKEFSKSIRFKELSLWWLTSIYEKDALKDHKWFNNLNKKIHNEKFLIKKDDFYLFEIFKLFLKLLKVIILNIIIKIFYKDKIVSNKFTKNCVYAPFSNLIDYNNNSLDIQYGLFSLKNKKISYAVQLNYDFSLIYNFFGIKKKLNKIPVNYFIVNRYVSLIEILKVYYLTAKNFCLLKALLKKKNYFLLDKKNCSEILKPLLLKSFFGNIQYSLITGISFRNLFVSKKFKNFLSYLEFFPTARSVYFFLKYELNTNLISINHANYSDNMLAYAIRKSEFSNKPDYLNYSPCPDIFCTQGKKYFNRLKDVFPKKKIYQIGSLKFGTQDIEIKRRKKIIFNNVKNKKIISIFTSIKDYLGIVGLLNKCDLNKFFIILKPHPYYKKETLKYFFENFKFQFNIMENFSPRDLINSSNFVLAGDSSLCYESVILGKKNTLRLYNQEYHPLFDAEDEVVTVKDFSQLNSFLNNEKKVKKVNSKKLIKDFFYKYDKYAHMRLKKILNNL